MHIQSFKTREEWLATRRCGIGGSDIAALLGLSEYGTPMTVWLEKTGQAPPREVTPQMEWGLRHEAALKQKFADSHPEFKLAGLPPYTLVQMDDCPWAVCSPDDFIGEDGVLETKAVGWRQAWKWGESETQEVPTDYLLQCHWNQGVCARTFSYIVPLIGGNDYREYPIPRDADLFMMALAEATRFWKEHVLTGIPPALDGSADTRRYLELKYPNQNGELPVVTDSSALRILHQFAVLHSHQDKTKEFMEELKSQIINIIGSNDGVLWPGGKITYRRPKDSQTTDWKAAFEMLSQDYIGICSNADMNRNSMPDSECGKEAQSEVKEIIASCTTTKVNSRRFLPNIEEGYVREEIESPSIAELP